jgi:hypothetical protein
MLTRLNEDDLYNPALKETGTSEEEVVQMRRQYTLIGADGKPYLSDTPGQLGGHRKLKIYGRLDCPSALRHIAKGEYVSHRVFFADEATAIAAAYRPCAVCMRSEYDAWKSSRQDGE